MKKKSLLFFIVIATIFLFTGCEKKKETKVEFEDMGDFIENVCGWNFSEENFKDTDFDRLEDEDYNVSYSGYVSIASINNVYCSYDFEDDKIVRSQLMFVADNSEEGIQMAKTLIDQLDKTCDIFIQEATNSAIKEYTLDPTYAFRINNDVDPMNNIEEMINSNVDGGEHSRIYKSKNGEFKDLKFSCETSSDSDGAIIFVTISNLKNDFQTAYYSEETE